ncbi:hypothetical protein WJX73_004750 [Symbiochloris irregularis]|uniref:SAP domain-containing protein n=1 Tax=Symbiochloris irregularis TaxID=706552 RepID=A0AAW1P1D6_9CHLO
MTDPAGPLTKSEVEALPYHELQAALRLRGLRAKGPTAELKERLLQYDGPEAATELTAGSSDEAQPQPKRRGRPPKTPKAAAQDEEDSDSDEDEDTNDHLPSAQASRATKAKRPTTGATGTPAAALSKAQHTAGRMTTTAGHVAGQVADGVKSAVKSAQQAVHQSAEKVQEVWTSTRKQLTRTFTHTPEGNTAQRSTRRWPQLDTVRHNVAHQAKRTYGFAKHTLHQAAAAVPRQARYITNWLHTQKARLRFVFAGQQDPNAPRCNRQLNFTSLDTVLDRKPEWVGVRESLHEVWDGVRHNDAKGIGVLLAGPTGAGLVPGMSAVQAVKDSLLAGTNCENCFLSFKSADLPKSAGELQSKLAKFLIRCPNGIVMVSDLHSLPSSVLSVFNNALSESGHFTDFGRQVAASNALYVFTIEVDVNLLTPASEEALAKKVKKALVDRLAHSQDLTKVAEAFRRRLDVVAPLAPLVNLN